MPSSACLWQARAHLKICHQEICAYAHAFVCICVCIYICAYKYVVYVYAHAYVCICICILTCTRIRNKHMLSYAYARAHVCICVCILIISTRIRDENTLSTRMHVRMFLHVHVHIWDQNMLSTHMHVHTHVYVYVYIYAHVCEIKICSLRANVCICVCIHICMHVFWKCESAHFWKSENAHFPNTCCRYRLAATFVLKVFSPFIPSGSQLIALSSAADWMNQSSKSAQWLHSPTSMTRVVSFVHPEMNEPRDSNEFVTSLNECQRYLPSMNPSIQVSRLNEPSDLNEYQTPKLSRLWIMNDSQQSAIRTIELINGPVFWTNSRNGINSDH